MGFNILLEDVSITQLTFSREYTAAVEAKQVAQQEAERAKYWVILFWNVANMFRLPISCHLGRESTQRKGERYHPGTRRGVLPFLYCWNARTFLCDGSRHKVPR